MHIYEIHYQIRIFFEIISNESKSLHLPMNQWIQWQHDILILTIIKSKVLFFATKTTIGDGINNQVFKLQSHKLKLR